MINTLSRWNSAIFSYTDVYNRPRNVRKSRCHYATIWHTNRTNKCRCRRSTTRHSCLDICSCPRRADTWHWLQSFAWSSELAETSWAGWRARAAVVRLCSVWHSVAFLYILSKSFKEPNFLTIWLQHML